MNRRVLLTGAGGLIGRAIGPLLPTGWDLVRTDLHASDGISALDVTDGVESMVRQIAELTGMSFFSTEIVQTDEGEYVVIDYVNDQCHMLCQSAHPEKGVPDEIVAAIARRLVHGIAALVRPGTHGPAAT